MHLNCLKFAALTGFCLSLAFVATAHGQGSIPFPNNNKKTPQTKNKTKSNPNPNPAPTPSPSAVPTSPAPVPPVASSLPISLQPQSSAGNPFSNPLAGTRYGSNPLVGGYNSGMIGSPLMSYPSFGPTSMPNACFFPSTGFDSSNYWGGQNRNPAWQWNLGNPYTMMNPYAYGGWSNTWMVSPNSNPWGMVQIPNPYAMPTYMGPYPLSGFGPYSYPGTMSNLGMPAQMSPMFGNLINNPAARPNLLFPLGDLGAVPFGMTSQSGADPVRQ